MLFLSVGLLHNISIVKNIASPASEEKTERRRSDPQLNVYWALTSAELMLELESRPAGLSSSEALMRLGEIGRNQLKVDSRIGALELFFRQFANPLVMILLFAVVVSAVAGEWADAAVILTIVLGSAIITFVQEYSANNAVAKLRARLTHFVTAIRDGQATKVAAEEIVPGDVLLLSAGTLIPADGVLIEADDCFVSQAVLTGETFPVQKQIEPVQADASLAERTNCVFMGTSVRSGMAKALIVRTGTATQYGEIAGELSLRAPETEFERGIRKFGYMLSRVMIALILAVFAVNVFFEKPVIDSLLFAIALAVGISPELLPAIITINLSKGAKVMARSGVIVRRLNSIENLGSMDVLCTDKTGTLTEGVVRLDASLDPDGDPSSEVELLAYLNAKFQTGLSNPLDEAIVSGRSPDIGNVKKKGEVPYDFARKRLTIVFDQPNGCRMVTKGALDNILDICTNIRRNDNTVSAIDGEVRSSIDNRFKAWSEQGYRVLGLATKDIAPDAAIGRADERDMTFEGYLLFFDPPKEDAENAIKELAALKVDLKIITGDNRHVALHVANSVGLTVSRVLTGNDLAHLSDEALLHLAEETTLFAEVDPNQKDRIIRALQKKGHVVGYMGDGINDAGALHDADVGISVDGAVDVAREAADFVLLEKGLDILKRGIEEGRATFANSLKYVFTTTSANFGNMFSMAAASLFLPFLPLLAKQILLNNFLSDVPAIAIAGDNVDREYIETPHRWNIRFIRNFMVVFGLVSSLFDFLTFGALLYVVRAAEPEFHTGWFIESLLTELFVALVVRTRRRFYMSKPGKWLWISTVAIAGLTIIIPYLPGVDILGFVPLPPFVMAIIVGLTLLYVLTTEITKHFFYRYSK